MAKSLTAMSVDALLKLRDEIANVLKQKAQTLQNELRAIGADYARVGQIAVYGRKSVAGRKVAPKYQGRNGELWSGRGAVPRWMAAEIKTGKKREDFLIAKPAKPPKRPAKKRHRKSGRNKRR